MPVKMLHFQNKLYDNIFNLSSSSEKQLA